jgi:autotransporter-associated beta strand protein
MTCRLQKLRNGLIALAALLTGLASLEAQGYRVSVYFDAGYGDIPAVADGNGTASNGYKVGIGSFLSANQSTVQALGYNRAWVADQFTSLSNSGNTTTFQAFGQNGSFSPEQPFLTTDTAFQGEQLWVLFSNNASIQSSTQYGLMTSNGANWTMPPGNGTAHIREMFSDEITATAFGFYTGTSAVDTLNAGVAPTGFLYWDSNGGAGLGGSGTWSADVADTEWTTLVSGASGDGSFAWGTTVEAAYQAGAGLTASFNGTAGTVTVNGTVTTHAGLRFDSPAYRLTSGTIALSGANATANTIHAFTGNTTIDSVLTGNAGLVKSGSGNLTLGGINTLAGTVTIAEGRLTANATGALGAAAGVVVETGGSLMIAADNSVSGNLTLDGGRLEIEGNGTSNTFGTLTLSSNSVIDLGHHTGERALIFAASEWITWIGTLSIWNWNGTNLYGTSYGAGDRQIFFGSNSTSLTSSQLSQISFYSDSGSSFIGNAFIKSDGEISVVPEPEAFVTLLLILAGLAVSRLRRPRPPVPPI